MSTALNKSIAATVVQRPAINRWRNATNQPVAPQVPPVNVRSASLDPPRDAQVPPPIPSRRAGARRVRRSRRDRRSKRGSELPREEEDRSKIKYETEPELISDLLSAVQHVKGLGVRSGTEDGRLNAQLPAEPKEDPKALIHRRNILSEIRACREERAGLEYRRQKEAIIARSRAVVQQGALEKALKEL